MALIIDMQFFKDGHNSFVPKELAVTSLNNNFTGHWIVKSSTSIQNLSADVRKENNWLTEHYHGLDYFQGDISLNVLRKKIRELSKKNNGRIFVRGKEKWLILQKLTLREIINLEYDIDCPSFDNLPWSDAYCIYHGMKTSYLKYACALNNVLRLKSWLLSRDPSRGLESPYQPLDLSYNEQSRVDAEAVDDPGTRCWRIPSRSDSPGVDETDGIHF